MIKKLFAVALAALLLASTGCAAYLDSWKGWPDPATAPLSVPRSDYVYGWGEGSYRVTVIVWPGDGRPYCAPPDSANDVRCDFTWGWLQEGSLLSLGGGWQFLTPPDARAACTEAMWALPHLATPDMVRTCGDLLMQTRILDLPPGAPESQ